MLLSYTIVDFDFYYNNGAVNMQICTLLTRIKCKVSDTQVTVKACGPLVSDVSGLPICLITKITIANIQVKVNFYKLHPNLQKIQMHYFINMCM